MLDSIGGGSSRSSSSAVKLVHGTCGWSDASLVRCGRFYPSSMRARASSEEKLRHYSRWGRGCTSRCMRYDGSAPSMLSVLEQMAAAPVQALWVR